MDILGASALTTPTVKPPTAEDWTTIDMSEDGAAGFGNVPAIEITADGMVLLEFTATARFHLSNQPSGLKVWFTIDGERQAAPAAIMHSRAADSLASETETLVARALVEFEADTYEIGVEIEYRGDAALGAYAGVLTAVTAEE